MEGLVLEVGVEAVKFVVESFMQRLNEQKRLIGDAPYQVAEMEKDLKFLKDYAKDAVKNPKRETLITRTLIRDVGDSVYRAEDAIDSFISELAERASWLCPGTVSKSKLVEIAQLINSVGDSVKKVREKVEQQIDRTGIAAENEGLGEYEVPSTQLYHNNFCTRKALLN